VCCVGGGHCRELVTRSEKSNRVRACVCVCEGLILCDTWIKSRPSPVLGCSPTESNVSLLTETPFAVAVVFQLLDSVVVSVLWALYEGVLIIL